MAEIVFRITRGVFLLAAVICLIVEKFVSGFGPALGAAWTGFIFICLSVAVNLVVQKFWWSTSLTWIESVVFDRQMKIANFFPIVAYAILAVLFMIL